jgi:hypothetical protein
MLHAAALSFDHPVTGEAQQFVSPLPRDIAEVHDALAGAER